MLQAAHDAAEEILADAKREADEIRRQAAEQAGSHREGGPTPFDLDRATIEELRDLGLSLTQAGRLVDHREACGGALTAAELELVPGLPAELRSRLRRYLNSGPGPR